MALVAGSAVNVDPTGSGLLNISVPAAAVNARLEQSGTISADAALLKAEWVWPEQPHDYYWGKYINGDIEVDETTTTKPTSGLDESASPVIVRDAEGGDDDEGPPAALVAVAVAALAVSGVGAGVIARSIRRRPGPL